MIHENYTNFYHYDIALVRVVGEIKFNQNVQPIEVADCNKENVPAIFAGWGSTYVSN